METKNKENLIIRPPVVVVLGHVDHGKTSLLDAIRKSHVADKESGGITQHIGAYQIDFQGKQITFIDTPGHEAFSAMRSRGAIVADIAILVIAADEQIQPQTKEAIEIIKKAEIPMIVALNKTDKPEAQPEKIKRELLKYEIIAESMGGQTPIIELSAKTGKGINELLDMIALVAEMAKLESDITKQAEGVIIESYLDNKRGSVASIILKEGRLKEGDFVATQSTFGKAKSLENFLGKRIQEASPGMPVIVLGLEKVPHVGEKLKNFLTEETAQSYVTIKQENSKGGQIFVTNSDQKVLNIILKADFLGSLEAIEEVIKELPQDKVQVRILESGAGEIDETDIKTAESGKAVIFGFRVKKSAIATSLSERLKVKVFIFDIIYDLIQAIRTLAEKLLDPEFSRNEIGKLKVLAIFKQEKSKQIIGGKIIDGEIKNHTRLEIQRNKEVVGQGRISQLQKNKNEVDKALKGQECGILFDGDVKIEEGDVLVAFEEERNKVGL